jgi:hypothetical protein
MMHGAATLQDHAEAGVGSVRLCLDTCGRVIQSYDLLSNTLCVTSCDKVHRVLLKTRQKRAHDLYSCRHHTCCKSSRTVASLAVAP